jgi:hypothetical protein
MKSRIRSCRWSFLFLLVATAVPGRAAPFSAELVNTRDGQTSTGAFNYQDKNYRFDFGEKGQQLIVLVDGQSGGMRLLSPSAKEYMEKGPKDPMSLFMNPFGAYAKLSKTKSVRTEGTESVGGVSCKKQVVFSGEQVMLNAWVSDEFDVPLKVEIPVYGITVELKNIKRGPQDAALFALPAGYKLKVEEPEPQPQPEWVGQVAGAPLLTVPFEQTLAAGGLVRVRPKAGRWLTIEGTNTGQGQGDFTEAPFKGGKCDSSSMGTVILDPGDTSAMTTGAGPDTTDEIIIRVNKGTMKIKTVFVAPQPRGQAAPASAEPSSPEPAVAETAAEVAGPASADVAARIEVSWKGPANNDDFIAVALPAQPPGASADRALVRNGNPSKIWAPSDPGEYEVRYVQGRGMKVLAKAPLTVNAVTATVEPPASAKAGTEFEVRWQGPGYADDYISVARPNQPPGGSVNLAKVRPGGTLKLRAPRQPGTYEVRYVLGRGHRLLAKAVIVVEASSP